MNESTRVQHKNIEVKPSGIKHNYLYLATKCEAKERAANTNNIT